MASWNRTADSPKKRGMLVFHLLDGIGTLKEALEIIAAQELSLNFIESRRSQNPKCDYEFVVTFQEIGKDELLALVEAMNNSGKAFVSSSTASGDTHWFPRCHEDMDSFATASLEYGQELDADHPGFKDPEYRKRRIEITNFARSFRYGRPLPHVEYTEDELETWRVVYSRLRELTASHACKAYNYVMPLLEANCGYGPHRIPQLAEVSKFLKKATGWTLRPVTGLLTPRDFLYGLAFRVFHSTQYIRHYSQPMYTPEPDVCHELIGHVPLFADPDFADFSQEIGLASLGATDEDIEKLATVYWFTVEFGLCLEDGKMKAFGAGLLSSFGELEYCLSDKPKLLPFDPRVVAETKYPITSYQPLYFYCESFDAAKRLVKDFAASLQRPFAVHYNTLTETIEVLDNKSTITRFAKEIQGRVNLLNDALQKLVF